MAAANIKSIVAMRENYEALAAARNASYKEVVQFYAGTDLQQAKKQGYLSGITKAITSIFSPPEDNEDLSVVTPINLVKPAVENKVAFLSLMPTTRVIEPPDSLAPMPAPTTPPAGAPPAMPMPGQPPMGLPTPEMPGAEPPGMELALPNSPPGVPAAPGATQDEDWASVFTDRLERVILTLLDANNMPKRCRDVAWSVAAMDGAVIGIWPDLRNGRPKIFTRTPEEFYPIAYDADGLDLKRALWVDRMTGDDIAAQYDIDDYLGMDEVEVTYYIDEEKFCTVLNDEKWAHTPVDNLMGLVPIVCVGSLGVPGMIFGSTTFKDAIPVAKQINYHMALIDKMANAMVEPTIFIKDPLSVPDDLAIGKGGVATAGPNGGVELLGPINLPNAFWELGQVLNGWFDLIADNPAQLRGQEGGSIITGKGFNAQLGPVAARMQVQLDIIMAAWKRAIKYMLLMWANFPGQQSKLESSGKTQNGEYYYIEATPDEFKLNGKMWTEIDVYLRATSYIDKQGNAIELIQLYQNELLDWNSVADDLPQITDKARVRKGIEKDRAWKAAGMAAAQAAAQSPMTANPELGQQERTNYGLERGFMGETGPPPGPTAEGGMAGPAPVEGPPPEDAGNPMVPEGEEDVVDILEEFFAGIGKLKGEVWFGGDPIHAPEKLSGDNWKVTVWVTNPQDIGTITRASERVEEIYGKIDFQRGRPGPEEGARKVSEGEEPVEAEPQAPATGNEDLDSMLTGGV